MAEVLVEAGERLVEQHQRRAGGQGTGQGDPLLLAAGELVGVAVAHVRQAHQVEDFGHPRAALGAGQTVEPEGDIGRDVEVGEERVVLEDQADATLLRRDPARPGDLAATELDGAGVGSLEPGRQPQQRGLAAPGGADEREDLAGRDVEVDGADRVVLGVRLRRAAQPQGGLGRDARGGLGGAHDASHHRACLVAGLRKVSATGTTATRTMSSAGRAARSQKFSEASS